MGGGDGSCNGRGAIDLKMMDNNEELSNVPTMRSGMMTECIIIVMVFFSEAVMPAARCACHNIVVCYGCLFIIHALMAAQPDQHYEQQGTNADSLPTQT